LSPSNEFYGLIDRIVCGCRAHGALHRPTSPVSWQQNPILATPLWLSQHGVARNFTAGAELAADMATRDSQSAALALPDGSCQLR